VSAIRYFEPTKLAYRYGLMSISADEYRTNIPTTQPVLLVKWHVDRRLSTSMRIADMHQSLTTASKLRVFEFC
jgi:hypothetical protein